MVVVNLVKTRNPIRRMLSGTWYKAVNEQGERLLWVPYTSVLFLANKMTVDDFLNLINNIDAVANIQLAFDRWNFGPGNKIDYEILRILLLVQEDKSSWFNDPFLKEQVRYIQTPLDIVKNISGNVIMWTVNVVAICLDFICGHTPDWVETFFEKVFEKMLGKF